MREDLVVVTSTNKALHKAKVTGKLNLSTVAYLNLITYYIKFLSTQPQTQENVDRLVVLKDIFAQVMNKCEEICNYRITLDLLCNGDDTAYTVGNNPPTVNGVTKIYEEGVYTFTYSDFTNNFNDPDLGDRPKYIEIVSLPTVGVLKYSGAAIPAGASFNLEDVSNITYEITTNESLLESDNFTFKTSDDNIKPLFSNEATYTFDLSNTTVNMPATIGDNTITVDNNVTTVLSLDMFTSQTTPPYNDPENDLIDAIRIDRIHGTNQGVFYVNGVEIVEGQIITREQLANNEFTHIGADINTIQTDGFEFSARDEGSGIWVQ
jgi:hypothetical protein